MATNSSLGRSPAAEAVTLILLPTEVKQAIFSQVEDIRTLVALAGSCRLFRDLLRYDPNPVVKQVLLRVIPPQILPEALTAYYSSRLRTIDGERVEACLQQWYFRCLKHAQCLPRSWSLLRAASLERFHRLVQKFTATFVERTLSKNPVIGSPDKCEPQPTYGELCRIQRAFYRFEICCNLFKGMRKCRDEGIPPLVIPVKEQARLFFGHFSPWENEQLGCIHDFLVRMVEEPFNDVAVHDVDWGEMEIRYNKLSLILEDDDVGSWLSLGLEFIHRLDKAKKYEDRLRILNASRDPLYVFLDTSLVSPYKTRNDTPLSECSAERLSRIVRPPAVIDHDQGPAEVWRVTHLEKPRREFVMAEDHSQLRESGYVMWDYDRLSRWRLFERLWRPIPGPSREETDKVYEEVMRSFQRRSEIWLKGGSGWWSEHDESKVVYMTNNQGGR